jgi:hypothetical protein
MSGGLRLTPETPSGSTLPWGRKRLSELGDAENRKGGWPGGEPTA